MNETGTRTPAGDPGEPQQAHAVQPGRPVYSGVQTTLRLPMVALAVAVLLILGMGTAMAFTVPVMSVTPSSGLARMLPADTAFYISADLNPTGITKQRLDTIVHDFTDQPGWAHLQSELNTASNQQSSTGACYQGANRQLSTAISGLGHEAAVALIGVKGISLSTHSAGTGSLVAGLKRNVVVLAALNIKQTLAQILVSGNLLSLPTKTAEYRGTAIYQVTIPSCGKVTSNAPQTLYAALVKGYAVFGLLPDPIKTVVDVSAGRRAALSSRRKYADLTSQLPGNRLVTYYVDASRFKSLLTNLKGFSVSISGPSVKDLHPSAGALTVDAGGFRLTGVTVSTGKSAGGPPAGEIAAHLPADTLALFSAKDFASTLQSALNTYGTGALGSSAQTRDIAATVKRLAHDMTGEADIVVLHPAGSLDLSGQNTASLPVALLWQVRNGSLAGRHLDQAAARLRLASQFSGRRLADGTVYHTARQGFGYGVRGHWAVLSLSIARALQSVTETPAQSLEAVSAYRASSPGGFTPTSRWYVNVQGVRKIVETSVLSGSMAAQYNTQVKPLVAPLHSVGAASGTARGGAYTVGVFVVGIGPGEGSRPGS